MSGIARRRFWDPYLSSSSDFFFTVLGSPSGRGRSTDGWWVLASGLLRSLWVVSAGVGFLVTEGNLLPVGPGGLDC